MQNSPTRHRQPSYTMQKNFQEQGFYKLETPGVTLSQTAQSLGPLKRFQESKVSSSTEWDKHFLK